MSLEEKSKKCERIGLASIFGGTSAYGGMPLKGGGQSDPVEPWATSIQPPPEVKMPGRS